MTANPVVSPNAARELDGRRIVVTGASRGLGRSMAVALAQAGAEVVVTGRDLVALKTTVATITEAGGTAHPYSLDVTDETAVEALADLVERELGPVDVLFTNAGIGLFKYALDTTAADFSQQLATNLLGTFACAKAFGRRMLQREHGKIITTASNIGFRGEPGWAAYGASKAAVVNLTETLAREWAPSVTVNCLAPGAFATDMNVDLLAIPGVTEGLVAATPLARIGRAEEIGRSVVYLAGPGTDFMTGSVLHLDGGILRS